MNELHPLILIEHNQELFVIVPGQDVLLTSAKLPKMSAQKLKQALPYALEDKLINDVNDLHFAIANQNTEGNISVAVVAKEKMQHWLTLLKNANVFPSAFIPTTLAIPKDQVLSDSVFSYIRHSDYLGFAVDHHNTELYSKDPVTKLTNEVIQHSIFQFPYINLLQGEFAVRRKKSSLKNVWKKASLLGLAWIGLYFFSHFISFLILEYQSHRINHQIETVYFKNFPNAKDLLAPRERMQQKLKETTALAQKNNFLSLLANVSGVFAKNRAVHIENLTYENGIMTLQLSAATFEALDALTNDLTSKGVNSKQQNAAENGSQVKATLLIGG